MDTQLTVIWHSTPTDPACHAVAFKLTLPRTLEEAQKGYFNRLIETLRSDHANQHGPVGYWDAEQSAWILPASMMPCLVGMLDVEKRANFTNLADVVVTGYNGYPIDAFHCRLHAPANDYFACLLAQHFYAGLDPLLSAETKKEINQSFGCEPEIPLLHVMAKVYEEKKLAVISRQPIEVDFSLLAGAGLFGPFWRTEGVSYSRTVGHYPDADGLDTEIRM